jgi:hypothetical protein
MTDIVGETISRLFQDMIYSIVVDVTVVSRPQLEIIASSIESLRSRAEKAEADRDDARRKLFPYADATEISGISWDGKYLIGDKKSIAYFHEMKNRGEQIDVYRRAFDEHRAALEATCEKLAKALEKFAKAGQVIDGPFGPALFAEDDMAFQSGCAWSENGVRTTITWGDFRRARSVLAAYRKEASE